MCVSRCVCVRACVRACTRQYGPLKPMPLIIYYKIMRLFTCMKLQESPDLIPALLDFALERLSLPLTIHDVQIIIELIIV